METGCNNFTERTNIEMMRPAKSTSLKFLSSRASHERSALII